MYIASSLLVTALALGGIADAAAGQLKQVTGFKSTPTAAKMYIYVPAKVTTPAPIILAIHYCTGTAQAYFTGSQYATLADTHGYIVIYPNSPSSGGCWDVASIATLTHNGGGDSETIMNMVDYAIANYGGDKDRVFATGTRYDSSLQSCLQTSSWIGPILICKLIVLVQ